MTEYAESRRLAKPEADANSTASPFQEGEQRIQRWLGVHPDARLQHDVHGSFADRDVRASCYRGTPAYTTSAIPVRKGGYFCSADTASFRCSRMSW